MWPDINYNKLLDLFHYLIQVELYWGIYFSGLNTCMHCMLHNLHIFICSIIKMLTCLKAYEMEDISILTQPSISCMNINCYNYQKVLATIYIIIMIFLELRGLTELLWAVRCCPPCSLILCGEICYNRCL